MPGALGWPYVYLWPRRPAGVIEEAFVEMPRRWRPILYAFDAGANHSDTALDIAIPGSALFEGVLDMLTHPSAQP